MLRTRRRNKITRPKEDRTLKQRGAECRDKGGIEPMGKIFLLTFLFIGLLVETAFAAFGVDLDFGLS